MRRTVLVVLIAAGATAMLLFSASRPTPAPVPVAVVPAAAGVPAQVSTPSVRVEHQLVTVRSSSPGVQKPRGRQPETRQAGAKSARPKNEGVFARARRILFGAGRHKPEPFPQERQR